jgi:hypothetical protein
MITTTLSILILALLWQFMLWRLFRSASRCVELAIVATSQVLGLDSRPGEPLTQGERDQARALAMRTTLHLLGRWRVMLVRLALGRWNLSDWLAAEIESAIYRLKNAQVLPMSVQGAKARNPLVELATRLAHEFMATYATRSSSMCAPFPGPDFGPTPKA